MMPCPTHVLSVWCAIFRPPASTEILQKVAGNYNYFTNRSLWQPPFGPACCAGRQQTAFSAGVIAPLVYPGFIVETMSAICGNTRRSHCKGTGVSGAAGRPCLLQAFACWSRLPAHTVAPGTCVVPLTVLQGSLLGLLLSGARQPCCCWPFLAGAAALTLGSREPQVGPICCRALRALFCPLRLRSRLQAFCFRELPGGPVTAGTSSLVLLFWHWCLGSRRPALFAADLCGRKLFCPLCFRSRLSAIRFQEMPGGPVAAVPWRQELLLGAGVSEAAGRPCLLQASSFWVPSVGPYSCT